MCSYCRARLLPGLTPAGGIEIFPMSGTKPMYPGWLGSNTVCAGLGAGSTCAMSTTAPTPGRRPPRAGIHGTTPAPSGCATSATRPGITRRGGRGFSYGRARRADPRRRGAERIAAIAIPPAWTDVWICSTARPHPGHRPRRARPQAVPLPPARGARCATRRSTTACSRSAGACPASARGRARPRAPRPAAGEGRSRRSCGCSRRRSIRVGNEEYARAERLVRR